MNPVAFVLMIIVVSLAITVMLCVACAAVWMFYEE